MADVFISYAQTERATALRIKGLVEDMGLSVFMDVEGLDGGDVFPDVLDRELKSARAVLGLWSPHALTRPWVRIECMIAKDRGVLVPVAIEPVDPMADVPAVFYGIQHIDLTDFEGDPQAPAWRLVERSLKRTLERQEQQVSQGSGPTPVQPDVSPLDAAAPPGAPPESAGAGPASPAGAPPPSTPAAATRPAEHARAGSGPPARAKLFALAGILALVVFGLFALRPPQPSGDPAAGGTSVPPATVQEALSETMFGARDSVFEPGCDRLVLDTNEGTLNGLGPAATWDEIQTQLPCFTGSTEEGRGFNYGGGVFYLNHDVYFYTFGDFIEVRAGFSGEIRPDIRDDDLSDVFLLREVESSDPSRRYFQRLWGCLVLLPQKNTLRLHARSCGSGLEAFESENR